MIAMFSLHKADEGGDGLAIKWIKPSGEFSIRAKAS